jgi:hypothetical protein
VAGGGIFCNYNGVMSISTSTISGNVITAGKAGAAGTIGLGGTGSTPGTNGTTPGIAGTAAGDRGGGVDADSASLYLSECTIAGNKAANGAGVSAYQGYATVIHNCTISLNKATGNGGGLYLGSESTNGDMTSVVSTIISGNTGSTAGSPPGSTTNPSPNIYGFLDDPAFCNLIDQPAMLGPLGYHDGGTTMTMLPSKHSPAVIGGPGLNPDDLSGDQNNMPFWALVYIGAVQTTH